MNILFGLIPALTICFVLWILVGMKIMLPRIAAVFSILAIVGGLFYSLQTYGPRVELAKAPIPYAPERVEVEKGAELIEPNDRLGQFDDQLGK